MKVLLLGSTGQLGWELQRSCPDNINIIIPQINLCDEKSNIEKYIDENKPDCIINASAYTDVDKAEQEIELCYRLNYEVVKEISEICYINNIYLIHISTDFVFDGKKNKPYKPFDSPNPLSIYGESKLKGEESVREILSDNSLIIRTSWLYSIHRNNFVKTMLKLMMSKDKLNIIDEQIGTPTWAYGLANVIWTSLNKNIKGLYHWTDSGVASWYDFAINIREEGFRIGILNKKIEIIPVSVEKYKTLAKRPIYSVLDKTSFLKIIGIQNIHWSIQLKKMLNELKNYK